MKDKALDLKTQYPLPYHLASL